MATRTPSYLKQRKQTWFVRVAVPRKYQAEVGKAEVVRSLGTRDKAEAQRRMYAAVATILAGFEQAAPRSPSGTPARTPEGLLQLAMDARRGVESGTEDEGNVQAGFDAEVDLFLSEQARKLGTDDAGHPLLPAPAAATIRKAHKALTGDLRRTLGYQWPVYVKEQASQLTAQTIDHKRGRLSAFTDWFGSDRDCVEVTRRVAGRYVSGVVLKRTQGAAGPHLSPITMRNEISVLRSFFDWLSVRGVVELNPFDRMASTVKASS